MKPINYSDVHDFQKIRLFGDKKDEQDALFTNMRVDRDTLPAGKHAYDLRENDNGDFCAIEPFVTVNHGGTVVCDKAIELNEQNWRKLRSTDVNFIC